MVSLSIPPQSLAPWERACSRISANAGAEHKPANYPRQADGTALSTIRVAMLKLRNWSVRLRYSCWATPVPPRNRRVGTCIFPPGRAMFPIIVQHPGIAVKRGVGDDRL